MRLGTHAPRWHQQAGRWQQSLPCLRQIVIAVQLCGAGARTHERTSGDTHARRAGCLLRPPQATEERRNPNYPDVGRPAHAGSTKKPGQPFGAHQAAACGPHKCVGRGVRWCQGPWMNACRAGRHAGSPGRAHLRAPRRVHFAGVMPRGRPGVRTTRVPSAADNQPHALL